MAAQQEIRYLRGELSRLSRRFRANADRLHPGMTFAAYFLLARMAGGQPVAFGELVTAAGLNKSTTSRQLTELSREGLVAREPAPEGRRAIVYRITDEGSRRLDAANATMDDSVAAQVADWSTEDIATLAHLLNRYNNPRPHA